MYVAAAPPDGTTHDSDQRPVPLPWVDVVRVGAATFYLTGMMWLLLFVLGGAIFGFSPQVIMSGSMEPRISTGDVVLNSTYDGETLLAPPTVVTFSTDGQGSVTHRIVAVDETTQTVTTRGDANRSADSVPVRKEHIEGVGRWLIPLAGMPLMWAHTGQWALLAAWAVSVMTAAWWASPPALPLPAAPTADDNDTEDGNDGEGDKERRLPPHTAVRSVAAVAAHRRSRRRVIAAAAATSLAAVTVVGVTYATVSTSQNRPGSTFVQNGTAAKDQLFLSELNAGDGQVFSLVQEARVDTAVTFPAGRSLRWAAGPLMGTPAEAVGQVTVTLDVVDSDADTMAVSVTQTVDGHERQVGRGAAPVDTSGVVDVPVLVNADLQDGDMFSVDIRFDGGPTQVLLDRSSVQLDSPIVVP